MIIKPAALSAQLKNHFAAIYLLTGPELLLSDQAAIEIKTAWSKLNPADTTKIELNNAAGWSELFQSAKNYSIFSDLSLIDARYDKKTLDSNSVSLITSYLNQSNARSMIIVRAPNLTTKSLPALSVHANIIHIHFSPLTPNALTQWIQQAFKQHGLNYQPDVPALIHRYSQHNLHACAQIIEKLAMTHNLETRVTCVDIMPHIIDQSEFSMYELADVCLLGDLTKALHIMQRLREDRSQPTLILWLLTQEVRQLLALKNKLSHTPMHLACQQQKIWSQRVGLYEQSLNRLTQKNIHYLLQAAQKIDEQIKSNTNQHIWHALEQWIMFWIQPFSFSANGRHIN